jgi:ribosomal protein S14
MKYKLKSNRYQRLKFKKIEFNKILYKILLKQKKLDTKSTVFYFYKVNKIKSNLNTLCILTGQSRSVYKFIGLSRFKLKSYIGKGLISGFHKFN